MAVELWVGFYKKNSGKPSITWPQSVDEALCFGWIDGIRKRLDETSYMIRFTPRRPAAFGVLSTFATPKNLSKRNECSRRGCKRSRREKNIDPEFILTNSAALNSKTSTFGSSNV